MCCEGFRAAERDPVEKILGVGNEYRDRGICSCGWPWRAAFLDATDVKRELNQMNVIWICIAGRFGGKVGSLVRAADPGTSTVSPAR
jgi:hypothetical protein